MEHQTEDQIIEPVTAGEVVVEAANGEAIADTPASAPTPSRPRRVGAMHVFFCIAWGVALVQLLALMLLPNTEQTENVFYWPVFIVTWSTELFWVATVSLSIASILYLANQTNATFVRAGYMFIVPWLFFIAAPPFLFSDLEQVGHATIDGQIYYAVNTSNPVEVAFSGVDRIVYACDRFGFSCEQVHREQVRRAGYLPCPECDM